MSLKSGELSLHVVISATVIARHVSEVRGALSLHVVMSATVIARHVSEVRGALLTRGH